MKETDIKDALGTMKAFHEDLPKKDKEELVFTPIVIIDARVIDDWNGDFGISQFCLLALELNGDKFTTLCGGKAVVRQVRRLLNTNKLPGRISCCLTKVTSPKSNQEYWLLDSVE